MARETLYRYRDIVDDFDAFLTAIKSERIACIRRNPHKVDRKTLIDELKESFEIVEEVPWYKDAFRLGYVETPGKTVWHAIGHYYVQEESAMVAALALKPEEHSRVLDMCAAPGGKTTQLSAIMKNTGTIIANDRAIPRLKSLVANVTRFACINVAVSWNDGRKLQAKEKFDYVLVDAPCTAEGNLKDSIKLAPLPMRIRLVKLQTELLRKAVELTKPSGVIVYSTCTFAPEENEGVVSKVLNEFENLKMEKIKLKVPHAKGLESFNEQIFGEELKKAMRIYPHHLNSGGAFIARIRKES